MVDSSIIQTISNILLQHAPGILGAIVALVLGWLFGKLIGSAVTHLLRKHGVDETLKPTLLGKAFERSKIQMSSIVGSLIKWIIFLLGILAASEALGLETLSSILRSVVSYLPYFLGGIIILVLGFFFTDFLGNFVGAMTEGSSVMLSRILVFMTKVIMGFATIIISLSVMKVDVTIFYIFAKALAEGLAIGAAVGIGIALGWGFKDIIAKNAENIIKNLGITLGKVQETRTIESLKARIKDLEKEIDTYRKRVESFEAERALTLEALSKPVKNLEETLSRVIGDRGRIVFSRGRYEIEVTNPQDFPWGPVILLLQNNGYNVWFTLKDNKCILMAKPSLP